MQHQLTAAIEVTPFGVSVGIQRCARCDGSPAKSFDNTHLVGTLTTDCPGAPPTEEQVRAISAGTLDFVDGCWGPPETRSRS